MDNRAQVREFLASRRARIPPDQAGLPAYGGNRRVKGLRREEVALLAGVSVDYYVRMERGSMAGGSGPVLAPRARRPPRAAAPRRSRARPPLPSRAAIRCTPRSSPTQARGDGTACAAAG